MAEFREFDSRFVSQCKCCSATIPQGDKCFGTKNSTGKWTVVCSKCYDSGDYKKLIDVPKESLSDVISKARAEEAKKNGVIDDTQNALDVDEAVEVPTMKLSEEDALKALPFEERIKKTAKWFIK